MSETKNVMAAHQRIAPATPFARYGYQIFRGDAAAHAQLKGRFTSWLWQKLEEFGVAPSTDFKLEDYHRLFEKEPLKHYEFISSVKRVVPHSVIDPQDPMLKLIEDVASEFFAARARLYDGKIEFRVVRPHHDDNNSLHRDHWFPYFYPLVNIYLPLASSFSDSAMKVVPGSHLWTDEDVVPEFPYEGGKSFNRAGIAYSVPRIKHCSKTIVEHRPDILPGDFMLFSPIAIHGGGDNFSPDTRFSLEIRLELEG